MRKSTFVRQNTAFKKLMEKYMEGQQSYTKVERGQGEGLLRVGQNIDFDEGIYSLGFVSQIKKEKMAIFLDFDSGTLVEEHIMD